MEQIIKYKHGENVVELIKGTIYDMVGSKVNFDGIETDINIYTGLGGAMEFYNKAVQDDRSFIETNIKTNGIDDIGHYTIYATLPFDNIKIRIQPVYDPIQANDTENPWKNGWRLSTFMYTIVHGEDKVVLCPYIGEGDNEQGGEKLAMYEIGLMGKIEQY